MKPERFLDALGDIPQEYLDDLAKWQNTAAPVSAETEQAVRRQTEPQDPEQEVITMKQNKRDINVRKLAPVTAGIFAGLAACAALVFHLGQKAIQKPDISPAASVSEDSAETLLDIETTPAVAPEAEAMPEELGTAVMQISDMAARHGLSLPADYEEDSVFAVFHSMDDVDRFLAGIGVQGSQNDLTLMAESFDFENESMLFFITKEKPENHLSYLRSVSITADGEMIINLNAFRNPTYDGGSYERYYIITAPKELETPEAGFKLVYTLYDSDVDYSAMNDAEIETAIRDEPVYWEMRAATPDRVPVVRYPENWLFPETVIVMNDSTAISEPGAYVYDANAQDGTWLQGSGCSDALMTRVNGCIDCNHTVLGIFANSPTQNALTAFSNLRLDDSGELYANCFSLIPETDAEEESTLATLYIFDSYVFDGKTACAPKHASFYASSEYGELFDEWSYNSNEAMFAAASGQPCIRVLNPAEFIEAPEKTDVDTDTGFESPEEAAEAEASKEAGEEITGGLPAVDSAEDLGRNPLKDAVLPEGYIVGLNDLPTILPSECGYVKMAFSNQHLRDTLGLWMVPSEEEAENFLELLNLTVPEKYADEEPEWDGGGFLLYVEKASGIGYEYEFLEDGFVRIAKVIPAEYICEAGTLCTDIGGYSDKMIAVLQAAQMTRDAEITAIINLAAQE